MKKQIILGIVLASLLLQTPVFKGQVSATPGQWSSSGSVIYYNDGKVGLGTSSPVGKFQVTGSDHLTHFDAIRLENVAGRYWYITAGQANHPTFGSYPLIIKQPAGSYSGCSGCGGDLVLQPYRNTIFDVGSVGIGTASPGSYKLAVNGSIKAKEVVVSNSGWADYVFEDGYKLMPIEEVEAFIKENKHLPNIPSAKNVEEQGLLLSDMQRLQMEKIEELTLHLIEKDKQIDSLEERVQRLETLLNI